MLESLIPWRHKNHRDELQKYAKPNRRVQDFSTAIQIVNHDRIHAREPTHDRDRWTIGTILDIGTRDGHCVVTVESETGRKHELTVTMAIRDLFLSRLDIEPDESPVGETVWYRRRGD